MYHKVLSKPDIQKGTVLSNNKLGFNDETNVEEPFSDNSFAK